MLAFALMSFGGAAQAEVSINYSLGYSDAYGNPTNPVGPVTVSESRTYVSTRGGTTTESVHGLASYGVLKAFASSNSGEKGDSSESQLIASFADSIVFSSAGLDGQAGFATIPVTYDWDLNSSGGYGNAIGSLRIGIGTAYAYVGESYLTRCSSPTACTSQDLFQRVYGSPESGTSYGYTPESVVPMTIPIVFGRAYSLQVSLTADTGSSALINLGGQAESDASHSYYWGGISAITDANGDAVSALVTSASGTNYLQAFTPAVPEPANAALLLAGLGVLAALRRRSRTFTRPRAPSAAADKA